MPFNMYGTAVVLPKRLNFIPYLMGICTFPGFVLGRLGEEERDVWNMQHLRESKKYIQVFKRKIAQ